jgi:hypothetical protein
MIRRIAARAALVGAAALVLRALAPKLHARMLAACEHMFEEMPDSFPPKRMLRGIDEIRVNSARTVELLEQREQAVERERFDEAVLS